MTNRKTKSAKHIGGKSFSFPVSLNPTQSILKKKKRDIKGKEFENLAKRLYGEGYIKNWYNENFRKALRFFKSYTRKERIVFSEGVKMISKSYSETERIKIDILTLLQMIKKMEATNGQLELNSLINYFIPIEKASIMEGSVTLTVSG